MATDRPLIVVTDTREPVGAWTFGEHEVVRACLKTGDYSIQGHEAPPDGIVIERKHPSDLAKCLTWDRTRWEKCLDRMDKFAVSFVIVECDLETFLDGRRWGHSHPSARLGSLTAWSFRHPRVHWIFVNDHDMAAMVAMKIFQRYLEELKDSERASAETQAAEAQEANVGAMQEVET